MAFNSNSYRMNQCRRKAWSELAMARDIKARAAKGEAYEWELPRIAFFVKMARFNMHFYLSHRAIKDLASQ